MLSLSRTALALTLTALVVSACASSAGADGTVSVVASTDVYGDLATTIGGNAVTVTSFLTNAGQDPHSYEASAHDELALSQAAVVIENGGGYDDFVDDLLGASGGHPTVLTAVTLSGRSTDNEHVWYDLPTVQRLVTKLVAVLSAADPPDAGTFRSNAAQLSAGLKGLERTEAHVRARFGGTGVAITEPVPLYLLQACGLVNRTPAEFSEAVEEGTGVSASILNQTLHLFSDHAVRALVYNAQTSGPETDQVVAAAKQADIATVPVTETLPAGQHYLSWMRANLDALTKALG